VRSNTLAWTQDFLSRRTQKQKELDKLQDWEKKWIMEFNADKCEVLRISNKRKNHEASYTTHGHTLILTKKAKYLGSILTPNMS